MTDSKAGKSSKRYLPKLLSLDDRQREEEFRAFILSCYKKEIFPVFGESPADFSESDLNRLLDPKLSALCGVSWTGPRDAKKKHAGEMTFGGPYLGCGYVDFHGRAALCSPSQALVIPAEKLSFFTSHNTRSLASQGAVSFERLTSLSPATMERLLFCPRLEEEYGFDTTSTSLMTGEDAGTIVAAVTLVRARAENRKLDSFASGRAYGDKLAGFFNSIPHHRQVPEGLFARRDYYEFSQEELNSLATFDDNQWDAFMPFASEVYSPIMNLFKPMLTPQGAELRGPVTTISELGDFEPEKIQKVCTAANALSFGFISMADIDSMSIERLEVAEHISHLCSRTWSKDKFPCSWQTDLTVSMKVQPLLQELTPREARYFTYFSELLEDGCLNLTEVKNIANSPGSDALFTRPVRMVSLIDWRGKEILERIDIERYGPLFEKYDDALYSLMDRVGPEVLDRLNDEEINSALSYIWNHPGRRAEETFADAIIYGLNHEKERKENLTGPARNFAAAFSRAAGGQNVPLDYDIAVSRIHHNDKIEALTISGPFPAGLGKLLDKLNIATHGNSRVTGRDAFLSVSREINPGTKGPAAIMVRPDKLEELQQALETLEHS